MSNLRPPAKPYEPHKPIEYMLKEIGKREGVYEVAVDDIPPNTHTIKFSGGGEWDYDLTFYAKEPLPEHELNRQRENYDKQRAYYERQLAKYHDDLKVYEAAQKVGEEAMQRELYERLKAKYG